MTWPCSALSALASEIGGESAGTHSELAVRIQPWVPLLPPGLKQPGKAWGEELDGAENLQGQTTKKSGIFAVERRRLRGDEIEIYNIPKEEGKVKIELVFTRAHSNKMGKSMHFFTQM